MTFFPNHKTLRLLTSVFAVVFALSLTACASETETDAGTEPDMTTEEPAPDTQGTAGMDQLMNGEAQATPQGTVSLLQQGVTNIAADQAVSNIEGWITQLEGADVPGASEIVSNLESLRSALESQPIDGAEVGNLLTELGQQTTDAAAEATGQQMTQLQTLGETLSSAGEQLAGGGM